MDSNESRIRIKLRIFFPIAFIIGLIIIVATVFFIKNSIKAFNKQTEKSLTLEVETITKMFEREQQLKLEKVKTNLVIAHNMLYSQNFTFSEVGEEKAVINQLTQNTHKVKINNWIAYDKLLNSNFEFVDSVKSLLGGTATIFQKIDSGYVRISTNVLNSDGSRAVNTYIPNNSNVITTIEKGETFYGRAFVVNDWYITAYEPIIINGEIKGILYVGNSEKDLDKLKDILYSIKIGKTGYPFVFDVDGNIIIHPTLEGQNWKDSLLFKQVISCKSNILHYNYLGEEKTASFKYFEDFQLYVIATIETQTENDVFIRNTILTSSFIALLTIIILLGFIYFLTADKIYKYLIQLDLSKKKLDSTTEKLHELEDRFQQLFNSVGDDIFVTDMNENIIEVNQASCINLGYSKKEFLKMKISEIKTPKYALQVQDNRRKIFENQIYTYESEHLTKDNRKIFVEMISRLIDYNNEKLVLSVARNISLRRETEKEILSTVIRTEERERARFAKDMHDSIGPLLSTIKLYVNELKSSTIDDEERENFVTEINGIIDESVSSIRVISNNLMPLTISQYGLIKALESFCEKVNRINSITIKIEKHNIIERLDQNMELILYRIITELINNTLKHAEAKNVLVKLEKIDDNISMFFSDDGIGFNIDETMNQEQKGLGLKNIISRIKSINGDYKFNSSPNNGFSIKINFDI